MEKTRKKKMTSSTIMKEKIEEPVMNASELLNNEVMQIKNCWGWQNTSEAACDVFNSLHRSLLEGIFIFGYKNTFGPDKSQLQQCVVVRFETDIFGVGVVSSSYTMLLPRVPISYLETELLEDLKKWKIEREIIETYKAILNNLRNEIISN